MWITIAICIAGFLFLVPFAIYPAVMMLLPKRREKPTQDSTDERLPGVALVICALNEEKVIGSKMENCLELDYPRDRLRILVVSDGSTDRTASIVRRYADRGIELIEQKARRGKIANLNEVLPQCREEILLLSDANVMYSPAAVRRLVGRFKDPQVGCVSGRVILTETGGGLERATDDYYSLEWMLQERSSQIYSMPGADGAMYALRRELFRPCPPDTLIEDFVIPMEVVRQGRRVVFERSAIAWEPGVQSLTEEFRRKVRIAAGSAQAMIRGNAWPENAPLQFWLIFMSHKCLRWLSPVLGSLVLLLCSLSMDQALSRVVLLGFLVLSVLAAVRLIVRRDHPLLSGPFYFLFGQTAVAVGLLKGLRGQQSVLWAKANR